MEINQEKLRRTAGGAHFERGEAYHRSGRVRSLAVDEMGATAVVDGTRPYRVRLALRGQTLVGDCNCPMGDDGVFCKHCVATGLAWVDTAATPATPVSPATPAGAAGSATGNDDLRAFLVGRDPHWLADLLLEAADGNPVLHARLLVSAGVDGADALDLSDFEDELRQAILIDEFVDWGGTATYLHDVDMALDTLEDLVDTGLPDAAIELCEYALSLLECSIEMIDDSDGGMRAAIHRAEGIHLRACETGGPDPVALAERLAAEALRSKWEVFLDAVPRYASVLGAEGLARFRQIVDRAWADLPPLAPGERATYGAGRFTVTHLKEALARLDDDVAALVSVRTHDLSSPYSFLRVAEILVGAGQDDEAVGWIERGIAAFPDNRDPRLRRLAAECHLRAGRAETALGLAWELFQQHPALGSYQWLRECAATGDSWARWRERALETLRAQPKAEPASRARPGWPVEGHSTLVNVLLWEGDVDAAWAAAQHGGCGEGLWLELARMRATDHPQDAIPVLQRHVATAIETKNRRGYQEAVRLLTELRAIYDRAGDGIGFAAHVRWLRSHHARKWSFLEELDRARLSR
jgi:uncharacterized Zn finger protein